MIVVNTNGQSIIVVSDNAGSVQPFVDELIAVGYDVTIRADLLGELTEDQIAELDDADLIIFARHTNSANYNFPDIWNNIDTPILMQSCFMTRTSRLFWLNTTENNETDGVEVTITDPDHPIFEGIDISSGTLAINNANPLHTNNIDDAGNGTILAVSATTGNIVIAEWPIDTEFFEDAGYYAMEYRAIFFTGLASDFTDDGKVLFLNFVNYILNPTEPVSAKRLNDGFRIFPSTVDQMLTVDGNISSDARYQIVTLSGQVVASSKLSNSKQIDASGLKAGLYVLKLSTNGQLVTRKIVKQ
jgi:hypothetical protein